MGATKRPARQSRCGTDEHLDSSEDSSFLALPFMVGSADLRFMPAADEGDALFTDAPPSAMRVVSLAG